MNKWQASAALTMALSAVIIAGCEKAPAPGSGRQSIPDAAAWIARGAGVYAQHCASCHGAKLEGQPEWRRRLPNGRLPAPPHDESGHTWHHPDEVLFAITRNGLLPPYAPKDYATDMPAYAGTLADDEIWAALAFIKSHWKASEILAARAQMMRDRQPR
ncbi:MAG: c-type cytochrome [Betaproteobacteria bacterium]|nr:c-type cytochrome [Betaproteobacteria bacterium]